MYTAYFVSGKLCDRPDELEQIIEKSVAAYTEQQDVLDRLKRNCSLYGLEYRGLTPGNGNCFFEAISCQMERLALDKIDPDQLRKNVIEYMSTNHTYKVQL